MPVSFRSSHRRHAAMLALCVVAGLGAGTLGYAYAPRPEAAKALQSKRFEQPRRCEHGMTGQAHTQWYPCTQYDDKVESL